MFFRLVINILFTFMIYFIESLLFYKIKYKLSKMIRKRTDILSEKFSVYANESNLECKRQRTTQRSKLLNNEDTLSVITNKLPWNDCLSMRLVSRICERVATKALQNNTEINMTYDDMSEGNAAKWKFIQDNNVKIKIAVDLSEGSKDIVHLINFIDNSENQSKLRWIANIELINEINEENIKMVQKILKKLPNLVSLKLMSDIYENNFVWIQEILNELMVFPSLNSLYLGDLWSSITFPKFSFLEVLYFKSINSPLALEIQDLENLRTFSCGNVNAPLKLENLTNLVSFSCDGEFVAAPIEFKNLPCLNFLSFKNFIVSESIIVDEEELFPCLESISYTGNVNSAPLKVFQRLQKLIEARAMARGQH